MENSFVKAVTDRLKGKRDKSLIAAELESHILDKKDYYIELGYDEETALQKATEDMGEPDDTALPLSALHGGAGRNWFNVIGIIFFAAAAIVPFFFHKFNYADSYFRAVYHLITIDFLSVAVIAGYVLFLIRAFKIKSKVIPVSAAAALIISIFNGMVIFRPAVFAVVKLVTSGFGGYADSVFSYAYLTEDMRLPLTVGSYVVFAILLTWAVIQFISVFMQERMYRTKKLNVAIKIIRRVISVLICAELLIMAVCTVIAAFDLPQKRESLYKERIEMINEVINTKVDDSSGSGMITNSTSPYSFNETVSYGSGGNNTITTGDGYTYYSRANFDMQFDALENYKVDGDLLFNRKYENLQEFLDEGWYGKAFWAAKSEALTFGNSSPRSVKFNVYTDENQIGVITFESPDGETDDLSKYIFVSTDGYFDTNKGVN